MKQSFTDEDHKKFCEFLNFIAKKAVFNSWNTEDTIQHFKLLAHMQQTILPKIEAHVFEMKELIQTKPTEE